MSPSTPKVRRTTTSRTSPRILDNPVAPAKMAVDRARRRRRGSAAPSSAPVVTRARIGERPEARTPATISPGPRGLLSRYAEHQAAKAPRRHRRPPAAREPALPLGREDAVQAARDGRGRRRWRGGSARPSRVRELHRQGCGDARDPSEPGRPQEGTGRPAHRRLLAAGGPYRPPVRIVTKSTHSVSHSRVSWD